MADEELEELELEDLEDDVEVDEEVTEDTGSTSSSVKFGTRELSEYIADEIDREYKPKELRILLRKMAHAGELDHEVKQGGGQRYSWDGPDDPEVKAILKRVKAGEIEDARQEALEKLQERQKRKKKYTNLTPDEVAELSIDKLKEVCSLHKISLKGIKKKSQLVARVVEELNLEENDEPELEAIDDLDDDLEELEE